MNNRFTNEELNILKMGVVEEANKDIRLHKAMPQETLHLLMEYLSIINSPENYSELDKEVNYNALLICFGFWNIYFTEGAEIAFARWQEREDNIRKENERIHKDIMERLINDIDKTIGEEAFDKTWGGMI